MSKKYSIPVYTIATATKHVTDIECDSYDEYLEIYDSNYNANSEKGYFYVISSNDLDIDESVLAEPESKGDIGCYEKTNIKQRLARLH